MDSCTVGMAMSVSRI